MILRLLGAQGIAGLAVSLCLGVLLVLQKVETRHWRKQSRQFELLYRGEQAAFAGTVVNYRAAAEAARAADKAAADRVAAEQRAISERTNDAYHLRLVDARTRAERLRREAAAVAADPVVAEARQCPPYPLPPADLMKPPVKTDFLPKTVSRPPSRPSSSTN